jgi:hypothetical protein
MPIPSLLTKTFLELPSMEPDQVATAFFETLYRCDIEVDFNNKNKASSIKTESNSEELVPVDQISSNNIERTNGTSNISDQVASQRFLEDCIHIFQFCHLCSIGKVTPVLLTSTNSSEAKAWRSSILSPANIIESKNTNVAKHKVPEPSLEDEDGNSPVSKLSRQDDVFINTMLKIHESVHKTLLKSTMEKEEKEPGFKKLEPHKKNFILNASAVPPYDSQVSEPTEFYSQFLAKKSQFKAKEMLIHKLSVDDVTFNSNTTFVSCLWNCEFLWILPDFPSGISIFFCPETKSLNASDLEMDRIISMADKVKQSDTDKLAKQKMVFPTCLMDLVWMTQNLLAIIKLCFGPKSSSAIFLSDWAAHMY